MLPSKLKKKKRVRKLLILKKTFKDPSVDEDVLMLFEDISTK